MQLSPHIGMDVSNIPEMILFCQEVLQAELVSKSSHVKFAVMKRGDLEINLFELGDFEGYKRESLKRLHLGFQVESEEEVDDFYARAKKGSYKILFSPYKRDDGDYTVFIEAPNGMAFEFYHGTHANYLK